MIPGKSQGAGTFVEGTIELRGEQYLLDATRTDGVRYGTRLTELIIEGEVFSPGTPNQINSMELAGLEFRLSDRRLDLRRPDLLEE